MASPTLAPLSTLKPLNVSITFKDHNTVIVKWKNPSSATASGNQRGWTRNRIELSFYSQTVSVDANGGMKTSGSVQESRTVVDTDRLETSHTTTFSRTWYYPSMNRVLVSVSAKVYGANSRGLSGYAYATISPSRPKAPNVTAAFDQDSGRVTFTVKTDAGEGSAERSSTTYWLTRQDSPGRQNTYATEKEVTARTANTATSFTESYDATDHALLAPGQWMQFKCYAYATGINGPSVRSSGVYRILRPNGRAIQEITKTASTGYQTGYVVIKLASSVDSDADKVTEKLQRLANTTVATQAAAAASNAWEDVEGAVDNAVTSGFSDQLSAATPDVKNHTWYRVVSQFGANVTNGKPKEALCLYRARDAASQDAIKWPSIESGDDGRSIELRMGWSTDDYTATEVTWSTNPDSWESAKQPESFILTWEDSSPQTGYGHTARFVIPDLEPGVPIYIRARRVYIDNGNVTLHGEWCSPPAQFYPLSPGESVADVTIDAPDYTTVGQGFDVLWTFNGDKATSWTVWRDTSTGRTILGNGSGAGGKLTIRPETVSVLGEIVLHVSVQAGGTSFDSEHKTVYIYRQPTLAMSAPAALSSLPLVVTATANVQTAAVWVRVIAGRNVDPGWPAGGGEQVAGDVVWAANVTPSWSGPFAGPYTGQIAIDAPLRDGGAYTVEAAAVDTASGLSSEIVETQVEVDLGHKAEAPGAAIAADAQGLSAAITPIAPDGAGEGDVCDVYRLGDGRAQLIAAGVEYGNTVTDAFAPFSADGEGLAYRLAGRTPDGDVDWQDVAYALAGKSLVIDYGSERVTLPWDVAKTDAYRKPFTQTPRWDGSMPGQWDGGVQHDATLSTSVIVPDGPEQATRLHRLGTYMGACFVRTPDGGAFAANVDVQGYGGATSAKAHPVSLNATEVDLTDEFRIGPDDIEEGE